MKKSIFFASLLAFLLSFGIVANAYSTQEYSIDVPSDYTETAQGVFTKENGNNFNVIVQDTEGSFFVYNDKTLDAYVSSLTDNLDSYRQGVKENLVEIYGDSMSEEEIDAYVESFKLESLSKKEITTCTENEYKCFHIVATYSMSDYGYSAETYSIVSGKKVYTLTFSVNDINDLNSPEKTEILNSFKINDYKAPVQSKLLKLTTQSLPVRVAAGAAAGAIVGVVLAIIKKLKSRVRKQK